MTASMETDSAAGVHPGALSAVLLGLGWDDAGTTHPSVDLDASVLLLGDSGQVLSDDHFVFYNNLTSPDGAVEHQGEWQHRVDRRDQHQEEIKVHLTRLSGDCARVVFAVSIHAADTDGPTFGDVPGAFVRVVDLNGGRELLRFDLTEDASTDSAVICGELHRHSGRWKLRVIGRGFGGGLAGIATAHGVVVT